MTDQSGTRWFNYDEHGRNVAVWDMRNTLGESCARVSTWSYDSSGRLTSRRLPTGRLLEYEYTGPDPTQPRTLYVTRADVDCSTAACPTGWSCNSGTQCRKAVASEIAMSGGVLKRWISTNGLRNMAESMLDGTPRLRSVPDDSFSREVTEADALGNPTRIEPHVLSTDTDHVLTYTPWMHWLESVSRDDFIYEYGLDDTLLGDRTSFDFTMQSDTAHQTMTYVPGSSRIATWEMVFPPAWAAFGSFVTDRRATLTYTAGGAVSEVDWEVKSSGSWVPSATTIVAYDGADRMSAWDGTTFKYDYGNQRTRKVSDVNSITTDFWYQDGDLQAELGCDSTCLLTEKRPLKEYIWLGGWPIAMLESELDPTGASDDMALAIYDLHPGFLGEPLMVTDSTQAVLWSTHSPYWGIDPPIANGMNLRFPGQYFDEETELHYNWHRYYWPILGRYIGVDPILARGNDGQPFGYADSNPITNTDVAGLQPNQCPAPPGGDDDCTIIAVGGGGTFKSPKTCLYRCRLDPTGANTFQQYEIHISLPPGMTRCPGDSGSPVKKRNLDDPAYQRKPLPGEKPPPIKPPRRPRCL